MTRSRAGPETVRSVTSTLSSAASSMRLASASERPMTLGTQRGSPRRGTGLTARAVSDLEPVARAARRCFLGLVVEPRDHDVADRLETALLHLRDHEDPALAD